MKKITLSIVLAMTAVFANAQRLDVFGGVSMTGISHKIDGKKQDGSGNITSHIGLSVFVPFSVADYKEGSGGGIFPALQYIKKGTSKSGIIDNRAADIKLSYLQLNVPYSYIVEDGYILGIGPYIGYAIGGKKKYRVGNGEKEKVNFDTDVKRLDYGISVHMNLAIFKLQYDYGLANIGGKTTIGTAKSRSFTLSLDIPLIY